MMTNEIGIVRYHGRQHVKWLDIFAPKFKEFLLHSPGETMDSVKFYVDTWFAQGVSFDNLNQYENAVEAYRQALRLQPEYADAWYNLGIAYINLKKYGLATLSFEEAVRIEPEKAGAWFNLGVAYYYQDKREKVREIYQVLRKLDSAIAEEYSKAVFTEFKITPSAHYSAPPDV